MGEAGGGGAKHAERLKAPNNLSDQRLSILTSPYGDLAVEEEDGEAVDFGPGGEGFDAAGLDVAADDVAEGVEGRVGSHAEAGSSVLFELGRKHQAEEIGVFEGEKHIGLAHGGHGVGGRAVGHRVHGGGKTLEAGDGEGFEERSARIEMAIGRGGGNADGARQITQTKPGFAVFFEKDQRGFKEGLAQIAVMIGRIEGS